MAVKKTKSIIYSVGHLYGEAFSALKRDPAIGFLFFILGAVNFTALMTLFYAPSSNILAPVIRTLWGERFLHYPENFALLPKLYNYSHLVILTVLGVFITGLVIKKLEAQKKNQRISVSEAMPAVFRRYIGLVIAWLISYIAFAGVMRYGVAAFIENLWLQILIGFILGVLVQALFIFMIPSVLLLKANLFQRLWKGLWFGLRHIGIACALLFLPMLAVVVLSVLKLFSPSFIQILPEIVLWILIAGVVVSVVVDFIVTSATAILFLNQKETL